MNPILWLVRIVTAYQGPTDEEWGRRKPVSSPAYPGRKTVLSLDGVTALGPQSLRVRP